MTEGASSRVMRSGEANRQTKGCDVVSVSEIYSGANYSGSTCTAKL